MTPPAQSQGTLFDLGGSTATHNHVSSTFLDNMRLPVHRWFRYSAGFSAEWVEQVITQAKDRGEVRVVDPFVGSGTALIAAEACGVESYGVEAHPFVAKVARAKLLCRTDPEKFLHLAGLMHDRAGHLRANLTSYPPIVRKCFTDDSLGRLDRLRRAWIELQDDSSASSLAWLALASILRSVSHVGTAPWQYVLPKKTKSNAAEPFLAFRVTTRMMASDMRRAAGPGPSARLVETDARQCAGVPSGFATLVVTSPPYANNYDYADAARLEMSFFGDIREWGDLQTVVRSRLVRSCSQHVPEKAVRLEETLSAPELLPIEAKLRAACERLSIERLAHGGKKTYHLMAACYFLDLAKVWRALRRVCGSPCQVCFVVGDSAPYGVYLSTAEWLGELAVAAGFDSYTFAKTRDRNVKWKNRKHRVPLCEGRLWVQG